MYQYWNFREIEETVKTLTIKRTPLGELLMIVVVDDVREPEAKFKTGKIAGFSFGGKTFLTISEETKIELPQFLKNPLTPLKQQVVSLLRNGKNRQTENVLEKTWFASMRMWQIAAVIGSGKWHMN